MAKSWVYERSRQGLIATLELGRYRCLREEAIARMVEGLERGLQLTPAAPGCADMARRSYGSGSLVVRANANGSQVWYGLWRTGRDA